MVVKKLYPLPYADSIDRKSLAFGILLQLTVTIIIRYSSNLKVCSIIDYILSVLKYFHMGYQNITKN